MQQTFSLKTHHPYIDEEHKSNMMRATSEEALAYKREAGHHMKNWVDSNLDANKIAYDEFDHHDYADNNPCPSILKVHAVEEQIPEADHAGELEVSESEDQEGEDNRATPMDNRATPMGSRLATEPNVKNPFTGHPSQIQFSGNPSQNAFSLVSRPSQLSPD